MAGLFFFDTLGGGGNVTALATNGMLKSE